MVSKDSIFAVCVEEGFCQDVTSGKRYRINGFIRFSNNTCFVVKDDAGDTRNIVTDHPHWKGLTFSDLLKHILE